MLWELLLFCKRVRYVEVMKMVNIFLKIFLLKILFRDLELFYFIIIIVYKR